MKWKKPAEFNHTSLGPFKSYIFGVFVIAIAMNRAVFDAGKAEGKEEGEKIGIEKGETEGSTETTKNIARAMKRMEIAIDKIEEATGLTAEEIKDL